MSKSDCDGKQPHAKKTMVMRREIAVELVALSCNFYSVWFQKKTLKSGTSVCFQITNVPQLDFGQKKRIKKNTIIRKLTKWATKCSKWMISVLRSLQEKMFLHFQCLVFVHLSLSSQILKWETCCPVARKGNHTCTVFQLKVQILHFHLERYDGWRSCLQSWTKYWVIILSPRVQLCESSSSWKT